MGGLDPDTIIDMYILYTCTQLAHAHDPTDDHVSTVFVAIYRDINYPFQQILDLLYYMSYCRIFVSLVSCFVVSSFVLI